MRRFKIWHETRYEFASSVNLGPHQLMVRPREGHDVRIESSRLDISPQHCTIVWHRDTHDNSVATASFDAPAQRLVITSEVIIQHFGEAPLDFMLSEYAIDYPFPYAVGDAEDLKPYRAEIGDQDTDALRDWLAGFWQAGTKAQTYALLKSLCSGIASGFKYKVRDEPNVQTPAQTLECGTGSCRDFANLFMEAARALGLAARFVSGYLHDPDAELGFGTTHAWAEVYLPGAGWKGFDPTIGDLTGSHHIPVAVGRRAAAVPPIAGTFFGSKGAFLALYVRVKVVELKAAGIAD